MMFLGFSCKILNFIFNFAQFSWHEETNTTISKSYFLIQIYQECYNYSGFIEINTKAVEAKWLYFLLF
jgi:hypothetical protein